jgi:hypothetical protein
MNVLAACYVVFFATLAVGVAVALVRGPSGLPHRPRVPDDTAGPPATEKAAPERIEVREPARSADLLVALRTIIRDEIRNHHELAVQDFLARPDVRFGGLLVERGDSLYEANLSIEYREDILAGQFGASAQSLELERLLRLTGTQNRA